MAPQVAQSCVVQDNSSHSAAPERECILLIDDSEDAMLLVQSTLQEYGGGRFRLLWASRLSEGLTQLSKGGVDVVLLDLGLPESSGPVSYAWVRQTAPDIPVVVLTGDDCEDTESAVKSSGAADYLLKQHLSGPPLLKALLKALETGRQLFASLTHTEKISRRFHLQAPQVKTFQEFGG